MAVASSSSLLSPYTAEGILKFLPRIPFTTSGEGTSLLCRRSSRKVLRLRAMTYSFKEKFQTGDDFPDDYAKWEPKKQPFELRRAGILLHPTSLPGPYGIGELGPQAFSFLDWLHGTGCSVWQVLPLVPPGRKAGEDGSPYAGQDANCGNTLLISLEELVKDGLLCEEELPKPMPITRIDFSEAAKMKDSLIAKAAKRLIDGSSMLKMELEVFRKLPEICVWLEDAAFFAAIDNKLNTYSWSEWPEPLRDRHLVALELVYQDQKDYIDLFIAQQFLFQRQWQKVHKYAQTKGIKIMGDMPIYVGCHSADVWANRSQFQLDRNGRPTFVSGVPPDAFSSTGQLWGSPLYDWKAMEKDGFSWWVQRMKRAYNLFDEFRIDHFRGLAGYWAVPAESETAMIGTWKVGPRESLFNAISNAVGQINIIAEDLGVITEDVVQLRKAIGAPGMAVLQFAFGSDSKNPYLLHNHEPDQVAYTGTHDNDTIKGWWISLPETERLNVIRYLKIKDQDEINWELIEGALSSVARTAIIPMQDILGLDSSARMNTPATQAGNWGWRLNIEDFNELDREAKKLKDLISLYNRSTN